MMRIQFPGLQTTVQDAGRDGFYAMGMPPAGALDQRSFHIANLLVGNAPGAAVLEFAFIGPAIEFLSDTLVSVTGADIAVQLDGEAQPAWQTLQVRSGQTLSFGSMTRGSRAYIAVRGGIDVPEHLGSRSTYQTIGFGGHEGRPLAIGDQIPVGTMVNAPAPVPGTALPERYLPSLAPHTEIAVVLGLCNYRFTDASVERFFATTFTVSHEANRTGYRLSGPALDFVPRDPPFGAGDDPSNVVNLGYPLGSIQIPSGTEPICLLRDAVTGGGYVTFGTIVSTDLDRISQLKSPETVQFVSVTVEDARATRAAAAAELRAIAQNLTDQPHS